LKHLTDSVRERIEELKAHEVLSIDEPSESPQEIMTRLKGLSKASDPQIIEWYGARYSEKLKKGITYETKDKIRNDEIKRFKLLVSESAGKELDTIIAGSPNPKKYAEALSQLKSGVGSLDTYNTQKLFENLEKDSIEAAKKLTPAPATEAAHTPEGQSDETGVEPEPEEESVQAPTEGKIGFEAEQYVRLLRKKIELEQKLKENLPKIAEIDAEIKAHKEAEAIIDEKKEQYIDKKRSWLLKGLKAVGYASLAGGWLGAMSGLTGVGVGIISGLTGVTDIGFFKGLGLGATWLFNSAYKYMGWIEGYYGIGKVSQLMVAALT